MAQRALKAILSVVAVAAVAVALWLLIGRELAYDQASIHWPTTTGRITSSRVTGPSSDDDYYFNVTYGYVVDGQTYTSDRLNFGPPPGFFKRDAQKRVANHPVGSEVQVHYDPINPSAAVLWPGDGTKFLMIYVGVPAVAALILFAAICA